ncbi:hypothetical protein A2U01_0092953, partial [Trifolium medium]|nr:hypothetical protein [Trifolium medium]
ADLDKVQTLLEMEYKPLVEQRSGYEVYPFLGKQELPGEKTQH